MIVNLNHFKNQWFGISSFSIGITYFRANNHINPNARKTIHFITIVQFWFQLTSILLLSNCNWLQWCSEKDESFDVSTRHIWFYYKFSLVFEMCDVTMSAYASYQLRKVKSYMSSNTGGVCSWTICNDLYVLTSTVWFLYFFRPKIDYIAMCWKGIIVCLFSVYKVYVIYRMYKDDKASHIVLEQISIPIEYDTPNSSDTKYQQLQLLNDYETEIATTAEKLDNFVPLIHKSGLKSIPIVQ